jgi:CDP-diacylglycerol--glycerol-3-phosphate 3-phosphatidyltransferase
VNEVPSVGSGEPERVVGSLRLFTLPNALSFARMAVLPPVLYLLRRGDPQSDRWALAILLVAGLTDLLDGWLARRRGAVSASGKVVDPLADKILIGGLVIYLALEREFPMWLLVAIVARDVALMVGAWLFFRRDKLVFAADWTGKWTTFFLGLLIRAPDCQRLRRDGSNETEGIAPDVDAGWGADDAPALRVTKALAAIGKGV